MRGFLGLAAMALLLAGCGEGPTGPEKPSITLQFPPDHPEQSQDAANAQCKIYNKTATLRGVEKVGEHMAAIFECV
jgi:uncharacterized lipoprotein YajG